MPLDRKAVAHIATLARIRVADQDLDGLAKGAISARELTAAHLDAMAAARGLNAYLCETPERALAMAGESDARRRAGKAGALEGIPLAVKDLFCTAGVATTAGSHIL